MLPQLPSHIHHSNPYPSPVQSVVGAPEEDGILTDGLKLHASASASARNPLEGQRAEAGPKVELKLAPSVTTGRSGSKDRGNRGGRRTTSEIEEGGGRARFASAARRGSWIIS